ncbi:oxidoreductase [Marivirga tractuosa]|uniref:Aldo/keto reductase n=1 Tax=Marivirga tractuosa (strain ATCC 23168 / DSM 4126 / NBRC 15989 / NCIMB 1408 / VKM B-1430 / H-43) TaxID=643867 RepID=E4TNQ1_MARTH|nr:aldo/keto reductase [Marivirga tractuosa]ADR21488.1 aldo/keto reductase [Marivirga tractuosa DSM 4126]BDD14058.1 oxidoreductase [Marivirga tractuosa]
MRQTSLSRKTITFSPFIVGTMRLGKWGENFNSKQWIEFVEKSLELGLKDFDHADIYGDYTTEADFGNVLKEKPHLRDEMQITTKCGIKMPAENRPANRIKSYDSSEKHIIQSVENSLRDLQTDYIDVLLLHRPDFLMNPNEIAETFEKLKDDGKVKYFGVSNFSTSQFEMINSVFPLVTHQIEASLNHLEPFEDGTLDQLLMKNICPTVWSPLGGGHYRHKGNSKADQKQDETFRKLSEKYELNNAQLMLLFLKRHPSGIIPVLGTSKTERLEEALKVESKTLEKEDWYALYSAAKGEELP